MPRDKATWKGLVSNVVNSIDNLVRAAIAHEKSEDQDSMGTYYEEKALDEALNELIEPFTEEQPHSKADNYLDT